MCREEGTNPTTEPEAAIVIPHTHRGVPQVPYNYTWPTPNPKTAPVENGNPKGERALNNKTSQRREWLRCSFISIIEVFQAMGMFVSRAIYIFLFRIFGQL